jgi:putative endonuclease
MDNLNYVYIFKSAPFDHLYIGVTSDLARRVRAAASPRKLVWFEPHPDLSAAIERERQLKKWNRAWKAKLVSNDNPTWRDLYADFAG